MRVDTATPTAPGTIARDTSLRWLPATKVELKSTLQSVIVLNNKQGVRIIWPLWTIPSVGFFVATLGRTAGQLNKTHTTRYFNICLNVVDSIDYFNTKLTMVIYSKVHERWCEHKKVMEVPPAIRARVHRLSPFLFLLKLVQCAGPTASVSRSYVGVILSMAIFTLGAWARLSLGTNVNHTFFQGPTPEFGPGVRARVQGRDLILGH